MPWNFIFSVLTTWYFSGFTNVSSKFVCVNTFMCNQSFSVLSSSVSEGYSLLKYHTTYCNREVPRFQRNSLPPSPSLLQCYHFNRLHGIISKQTVIFIVPAIRSSSLSSVLVSLTMWIQNFISMICSLSKSHFAYTEGSWVRVWRVMSMSMCTGSSYPLICTMAYLLLSLWIKYKETLACGSRKCCHFYDKTNVATSTVSFKHFKTWELTVTVLQFLWIVIVITVRSVINYISFNPKWRLQV